MKLRQMLPGLEVIRVVGSESLDITGLHYDSRKIEPGNLFVAIPGLKSDGHQYIPSAISAGAVAVVVERPVEVPPEVTRLEVRDSRSALSCLAAAYYGHPSTRLRLIGVTGTNGKTTTAHLVEAILIRAGYRVGLLGTIGGRLGEHSFPISHTTPESLDLQQMLSRMVEEGANYVVMEVSSHALALKRVQDCEFDVGVFTNLTQDHLDFHSSMEEYAQAKRQLFAGLGSTGSKHKPKYAAINLDDPAAWALIEATPVPVITYGLSKNAQVGARGVEVHPQGTSLTAILPDGELPLNLRLTGRFNTYNALAALTVGWREGVPLEEIKAALEGVRGVPGRFEPVDQGQDFAVIVDYAHTPDGLENLLATAREVTGRKLITVFGCGGDRDRGKRPLMGEVAARWSDYVIVTSDNPRTEEPGKIIEEILPGLKGLSPRQYEVIEDRRAAIYRALELAEAGDAVVIAGKGHETYQIVGNQTFPFDDREVAREGLRRLNGMMTSVTKNMPI